MPTLVAKDTVILTQAGSSSARVVQAGEAFEATDEQAERLVRIGYAAPRQRRVKKEA